MMNQNNDNFTEQDGLNINADENVSGTEHLNDPVEESQLNALEAELNESKDKYLRLAAEFDNFRKRTAKERIELFQTAGKDIITDLLDVLDDVDRASKEVEESSDAHLKQGVSLIFNKLKNILQSKGLKAMEAKGVAFDPELHEAITEIPAPAEGLQGKIVDEISKGYYLNDKIIRHAKVVVGK
ncbi:nucleotide exchange factor GrpE [Niabella sp. CJ426]|jgi:molecular chaperone GrpE|uniref:nucleotide exchange factor GrpE n=1 Tax=unclassified Niabella TaxID=2646634 RepID=UPI003D02C644